MPILGFSSSSSTPSLASRKAVFFFSFFFTWSVPLWKAEQGEKLFVLGVQNIMVILLPKSRSFRLLLRVVTVLVKMLRGCSSITPEVSKAKMAWSWLSWAGHWQSAPFSCLPVCLLPTAVSGNCLMTEFFLVGSFTGKLFPGYLWHCLASILLCVIFIVRIVTGRFQVFTGIIKFIWDLRTMRNAFLYISCTTVYIWELKIL